MARSCPAPSAWVWPLPQTGFDHKPVDLLRDAHTAMYRAKALGKSRFEIFAAGMLTEAVNRLQLESDLTHSPG